MHAMGETTILESPKQNMSKKEFIDHVIENVDFNPPFWIVMYHSYSADSSTAEIRWIDYIKMKMKDFLQDYILDEELIKLPDEDDLYEYSDQAVDVHNYT